MQDNLNIAEILCDSGANVDLYGQMNDNIEYYEIEIENEQFLLTPLHLSTKLQSLTLTKLLIDKGANINLLTLNKETSFSIALKLKN